VGEWGLVHAAMAGGSDEDLLPILLLVFILSDIAFRLRRVRTVLAALRFVFYFYSNNPPACYMVRRRNVDSVDLDVCLSLS